MGDKVAGVAGVTWGQTRAPVTLCTLIFALIVTDAL
jgi:hypothetical protein